MVNPTSDYSADTIEASDGLPALVVGPWWREKHHYIRRYQEIFRKSMSDKWPHRVYADLFAGPGRCVIERSQEEIDGSPVVAMAADKPFPECYFADESGDFIEALKHRVRRRGDAQFFIGDANVIVDDVVSQLPDKQSSLGLAFLDPFGYELDFGTLGKLTAGRR